jgi:glycosyltransferase involved in cell wall biosynthesis
MKISLCLTTFNRYDLTVKAIDQVLDDQRIDDVVILDDASTDGSYEKLVDHFFGKKKVRIIRQGINRGMARNKMDAIFYSDATYCIIFDSDNVIGPDYLDAMEGVSPHGFRDDVILVPEYAMPGFDFTAYSGMYINSSNAKKYMEDPMFRCLLNCCNYVVPVNAYLLCYEEDKSIKGTDTIKFNYLWLKNGNQFFVVPGMRYKHLQHAGSGFLADIDYNMAKAKEIENLIRAL